MELVATLTLTVSSKLVRSHHFNTKQNNINKTESSTLVVLQKSASSKPLPKVVVGLLCIKVRDVFNSLEKVSFTKTARNLGLNTLITIARMTVVKCCFRLNKAVPIV